MSTSCLINCNATIRELLIYHEKCTACMSCILACSFHHIRKFDRRNSSIEVRTSKKEREIQILIQKGKEGGLPACDYCEEEKEPLCVKYCFPKAIIFKKDLK